MRWTCAVKFIFVNKQSWRRWCWLCNGEDSAKMFRWLMATKVTQLSVNAALWCDEGWLCAISVYIHNGCVVLSLFSPFNWFIQKIFIFLLRVAWVCCRFHHRVASAKMIRIKNLLLASTSSRKLFERLIWIFRKTAMISRHSSFVSSSCLSDFQPIFISHPSQLHTKAGQLKSTDALCSV